MGYGGILAGALGGIGQGIAQQATGYIEDERKVGVAKEISAMEEARNQRAEEFKNGLARGNLDYAAELTRTNAAKERERQSGVIAGAANNREAIQRLRDSGDIAGAKALRELSTPHNLPYGGIAYDDDGKIVADNDSAGKAQADYYKALAANARGAANKRPDMLPEAAKIQLDNIEKRTSKLQEQLDKARGDAMYDPKGKGVQEMQAELGQLNMGRMRIYAQHGLIDGAADAQQAIASGLDGPALAVQVKKAHLLDPAKYGPAFEAAVRASGKLDAPAPAQGDAVKPGSAITKQGAQANPLLQVPDAQLEAISRDGKQPSKARMDAFDELQRRRGWDQQPAPGIINSEIDYVGRGMGVGM